MKATYSFSLLGLCMLFLFSCELSENGDDQKSCVEVFKGRVIFDECNTVIQLLSTHQDVQTSSWTNPRDGKTYDRVLRRMNDCRLESRTWGLGDEIYFILGGKEEDCLWCDSTINQVEFGYTIDYISTKAIGPCNDLITTN